MCTQYKQTVRNGEILDEHDLIRKYLLHDQDYDTIFNKKNAKPILWQCKCIPPLSNTHSMQRKRLVLSKTVPEKLGLKVKKRMILVNV
jgi:hypothetical protein